MSRFTAFAAALALLVSGIAIGVLGTLLVEGRRRPPHEAFGGGPPRPGRMLDDLKQQLALSPEQETKIAAILDEGRREGEALRREMRPRLDQQVEAVRRRIEAELTAAQRTKFEELRRRAWRFLLEGPPPGFPRGGPPHDGPPHDGPPHDGPPPGGPPPPGDGPAPEGPPPAPR